MANDKILFLHGNYRVLEKLPRVTPQSAEVGRVLSRRPHKTVLTYSALSSAKDIVRQTQRSLSSLAHRVCFLLCPPKVSWALASVSFFPALLSIALHSWLPLHLFTPPFPISQHTAFMPAFPTVFSKPPSLLLVHR